MIPCKNTRRLCFIFGGGGGGVESRPVDVGGLQKGPFIATKWAQNDVILVGLGLKCIYIPNCLCVARVFC